MTDAGWQPDPTGRHQHRYWNGTTWTEHVADNGVQSTDPPTLDAPTPPVPTTIATVAASVPKKKRRAWPWVVAGAVVVVIVIAAIAGGSSDNNKASTQSAQSPQVAASSPSTVAVTTPPTTAAPAVVFHQDGSGISTSQTFTVKDAWDLAWSYDCSKFGMSGNFQVYVYNSDGSLDFNNAGVNQLGSSGNGVEHFHTGGAKYLVMNSECNWSVNVTS